MSIEINWLSSPPPDGTRHAEAIAAMHESLLRSRVTEATMHAAHQFACAIAAYALIGPPSYRHRRGRAVSTSAKRRHRRRQASLVMFGVLHTAAGQAFSEAARYGAEVLDAREVAS